MFLTLQGPDSTLFSKIPTKCLMENQNGVDVQNKVININVKITSVRLDSSYLLLIF